MQFDYNKIMVTQSGKYFCIAFRDLAQEYSFDEILNDCKHLSSEKLLGILVRILEKQKIFLNSNSERDGLYSIMRGEKGIIETIAQNMTRKADKASSNRRRVHTQPIDYLQPLIFNRATPRNLLIVSVAIMSNVSEYDSIRFYVDFYTQICEEFPEMKEILPKYVSRFD